MLTIILKHLATGTCRLFRSNTTRRSEPSPSEPGPASPRQQPCWSCTGCCCSSGTWSRRSPGTSGWGESYRSPCTWCTDGWSSHLDTHTHTYTHTHTHTHIHTHTHTHTHIHTHTHTHTLYTVSLCLHVADPATFLSSDIVLSSENSLSLYHYLINIIDI